MQYNWFATFHAGRALPAPRPRPRRPRAAKAVPAPAPPPQVQEPPAPAPVPASAVDTVDGIAGYPAPNSEGVRQVMDAALVAGYQMDKDAAMHFLLHYSALRWRGHNGQMLNWRYKAAEWALKDKMERKKNEYGNNGGKNGLRGTGYVSDWTDGGGFESVLGQD